MVKEIIEVNKQDTNKQEETKKDKVADKVGYSVEVNNLQITFNFTKYAELSEFYTSDKGNVLEIAFSAKNNGKKESYFRSEELKIVDANGNQFKEYFGADDAFMNENISPRNQITGKMCYDVAEFEEYIGTYKPNFTFDEKSVQFEFTATQ